MEDQRNKLREMMQSDSIPNTEKWDTLWRQSITPWDRGVPSPALVELLVDKKFSLFPDSTGKTTQVLVPGCGRGYDVVLFAGLTGPDQRVDKAVGLDISQKGIEEAKKRHANSPGNIQFLVGDFFSKSEDWAKAGPYDVVYDYTFLCALRPDMRSAWAERMAEIITPETGLLIALQHPIDPSFFHKADPTAGPPFLLSPEIYDELLGKNFERIYFEPPGKYHAPIGEKDRMSVWRRRSE